MNRKRVSAFLLIAVVLVAGLGFFLSLDAGASRQGRGHGAEGRTTAGAVGSSADGRASGGALADAAALRELIAKYGCTGSVTSGCTQMW